MGSQTGLISLVHRTNPARMPVDPGQVTVGRHPKPKPWLAAGPREHEPIAEALFGGVDQRCITY